MAAIELRQKAVARISTSLEQLSLGTSQRWRGYDNKIDRTQESVLEKDAACLVRIWCYTNRSDFDGTPAAITTTETNCVGSSSVSTRSIAGTRSKGKIPWA